MKKVMISQPMGNLSQEEILEKRNKIMQELEKQGFEVLNTYYVDGPHKENDCGIDAGLWYLGRSLMDMAKVDAVFFCDCWEHYRGCLIEHETAMKYGLEILYETCPMPTFFK